MQAYLAGEPRAFEQLYARHRGALYRYFSRQLSADAAADCFQKVWLKLIQNRARYRAEGRFSAYLFRIAHNTLMDHYRGHRLATVAGSPADEPTAPSEQQPPEALERRSLRHRLLQLIEELPIHQRQVWLMQQESDLSLKEIAELTGSSSEGVKSRLRYAREKLRKGLARHV